jgi:prepilin-type N-terminal cleavage/methylation domain-containing protein
MTPMRQVRGFTLIELMVTMAIGSILLLAAASLLGSSGESYERIGGGVAAEREARALVTQFTSDLSTAVYHKDGVFEESSASWTVDRIGFLSLQPAEAQTDSGRVGDLCAVNYYIKDITIDGKTVRCLMRGFRESKETFEALENDSIPSLFVAQDTIDEPVAFGVVSFESRPKSRDASGQWIDWIPNDTAGPEALETRLIVARRGLAARLKTTSDWDQSQVLGPPTESDRNKDLEIFAAMIRFGNHEN